ncbi:MAG: Dicer-like protein 2 [Thelocarpon superellum]|nr:MAG: Dicer-like protein 2 [Thelocarpon superellum]
MDRSMEQAVDEIIGSSASFHTNLAVEQLPRSRAYQIEMFDASMKKNVIVTMDTGSGKTHIALLRMRAELIWFLAPTVALCDQQHGEIVAWLPAVRTRLLLGPDKVDLWKEKRIWEAVLEGVQVVVSTHAILADALGHGFITMDRLALLVFDEAHHCARGHPANSIMKNFYHPHRDERGDQAVPDILGLTASPILRSKPKELQLIEANLHSISITPSVHRAELRTFVHPPSLKRVVYDVPSPKLPSKLSGMLRRLLSVRRSMDIHNDPYVLTTLSDEGRAWKVPKIVDSRKTYSEDQMKKFCSRAQRVQEELGSWGADFYITTCVSRFGDLTRSKREMALDWDDDEYAYLLGLLDEVTRDTLDDTTDDCLPAISPKVEELLKVITSETRDDLVAIVFVEQRATAYCLSELLHAHPWTRDRIRSGTFVGMSNYSGGRKGLWELSDARGQSETLEAFRKGEKNLIVTTSVLEEGIDISACNVVICFSKPPTLKSFVQRRGRARQKNATYVIMFASDDESGGTEKWQQLEREMIAMYRSQTRTVEEGPVCDDLEDDDRELRVPSTGALLRPEWAVSRLYHFCAVLPAQPYTDLRPAFQVDEDALSHRFSATVTLPNSVDAAVRQSVSHKAWLSEQKARKDAAFQAYMALYRAGLLNEHLLPLRSTYDDVTLGTVEKRPSLVAASEQYNPWVEMAKSWATSSTCRCKPITILRPGRTSVTLNLLLSLPIESPLSFSLHVDKTSTFQAQVARGSETRDVGEEDLKMLRSATDLLLRAVYRTRMSTDARDFLALFAPCLDFSSLEAWVQRYSGDLPALGVEGIEKDAWPYGLLRTTDERGTPFVYRGTFEGQDDTLDAKALELSPLPRRRNFLHYGFITDETDGATNGEESSSNSASNVITLSPATCKVDRLPMEWTQFALFIPSILHRLETAHVAEAMCKHVLGGMQFHDIGLVITAISASSASDVSNYQRLEFLGDSVLKMVVSGQLFSKHTSWHEGYLSAHRDAVVSNARLARAAVDTGLDRYIITRQFTGQKWRPWYISELTGLCDDGKRTISTKILADVVEALIGAAFIDGGFERAVRCMRRFLPEVDDQSHEALLRARAYRSSRPQTTSEAPHLSDLERLLDHRFKDKSLLREALTHPSCDADLSSVSYQRLEFLGDAVLDMIMVQHVFDQSAIQAHGHLHLLKTAMVNANMLTYIALSASIESTRTVVKMETHGRTIRKHEMAETVHTALWKFLKHETDQVTRAQKDMETRSAPLKPELENALLGNTDVQADKEHEPALPQTGAKQGARYYPWHTLSLLGGEKFFSDMVESLFGAVYVDSQGDLSVCVHVAEKLGLLAILRRLLRDKVDVTHPKNRLGVLAGDRSVEYVFVRESPRSDQEVLRDRDDGDDGERQEWRCVVKIAGDEIVRVSALSSSYGIPATAVKEEMVIRAAEAAIVALSA